VICLISTHFRRVISDNICHATCHTLFLSLLLSTHFPIRYIFITIFIHFYHYFYHYALHFRSDTIQSTIFYHRQRERHTHTHIQKYYSTRMGKCAIENYKLIAFNFFSNFRIFFLAIVFFSRITLLSDRVFLSDRVLLKKKKVRFTLTVSIFFRSFLKRKPKKSSNVRNKVCMFINILKLMLYL